MTGPGRPPTGVLVMAHGTPSSRDGIEAFYTAIRRGRPPTTELLDELVARYDTIGGTSPLTERTRAQVDGLEAVLSAAAPGDYLVRYGAKHAVPSIEEGMAQLAAAGAERVVGIVLTPHESALGSGEYLRRARAAAGSDIELVAVPSWHRTRGFAQLLADRTATTLASIGEADLRRTAVFFTAHSLPERAIAAGDPYADQVHESAVDIARLLGFASTGDSIGTAGTDDTAGSAGTHPPTWGVAWQSAGRTAELWMGPDLLAEMRRVAGDGVTAVVVCPVGFVSDHLEILYDLDVEARGVATATGLSFARTRSLNDDPRFLHLLAGVVRDVATAPGGRKRFVGSTPPA